jgi:hypothetical protein
LITDLAFDEELIRDIDAAIAASNRLLAAKGNPRHLMRQCLRTADRMDRTRKRIERQPKAAVWRLAPRRKTKTVPRWRRVIVRRRARRHIARRSSGGNRGDPDPAPDPETKCAAEGVQSSAALISCRCRAALTTQPSRETVVACSFTSVFTGGKARARAPLVFPRESAKCRTGM